MASVWQETDHMKSELKLSYEKQIKEMREKYEPGHSPAELIESRA